MASSDQVRRSLAFKSEGVQKTNQIVGSRRWWALGAVLITMFFSSLDQTIVATAMPVIIGDLQGFNLYAWVFTAYMMASAVTVPIYGKLSDIYGRKPFYALGLGLFILGSMGSGLVQTMPQLIIARAFQGLGAGAMLSMPRATIGDIFNPRERGRWMGVISSVFGLASIVGPTMGGWITDTWGWRWIFYINLPVALAALAAVLYALPSVRTEESRHVDWLGSTVLAAGLIPLLLAFTWAGSTYPWASPQIVGLLILSAILLTGFVWVERRALAPIIPPELFRNRVFTTTNAVGFFISMGMFGSIAFLPLFVQGAMGESAQASGQILTPMMLSFITGSVVGGYLISRTGKYKLQAIIGSLLALIGMVLLTQMDASTQPWTVVRNMLVMGLGIGSILPLLNVAVQNVFPYRMMGVVNSAQQFVRSLGGIIATPIMGTVLVSAFSDKFRAQMSAPLAQALQSLPPDQRQALLDPQGLINANGQAAVQSAFATIGGDQAVQMYQAFIHDVQNALAGAMQQIFFLGVIFAGLALLLTFFLPEEELKQDEFFAGESAPPAT